MAKNQITWHTESRKVSDLVPYSKNPRTLSDKQRRDLEKSITKFGLAEIPAINTDNTVIAGHQRLKILLALGRGSDKIDVRVPNRKLTKKEFEEYLLRSNKNTGSWDYELLKAFDTDFLLDIGFTDDDMSSIWDDVLEIEDDEFDDEKELAKAKTTSVKLGDVYELGRHKLICGDSTDVSVVKKLLGRTKVDMVYSDPPYNIALDYDKGIGGKKHYGGSVNDNLSDSEYRLFIEKALRNALAVTNPNAHIFFWSDQKYVGMLQGLYAELSIAYKRTCLWIKNGISPTPKVAFNKCYEPCNYGTVGTPYLSDNKSLNEVLNKEVGTGNATIDDIVDILDIWLAKRIANDEYQHPTQKPVTLHEKPLRRCTKIGDVVLDLFGGSGSTLLACEQMKRRSFVVEKDPVFCQLIINRYEKFSKAKATKLV